VKKIRAYERLKRGRYSYMEESLGYTKFPDGHDSELKDIGRPSGVLEEEISL
jgi:hypothetical protein